MELKYVKESYNTIADHFDRTRTNHWPRVKQFINSLGANSTLLDAGCGNGKNMEIRDDLIQIGCDNSEKLVDICKNKNLNVILSDIKILPFNDNSFDNVICIAVIHHLSTKENRINALKELLRVLKPKGCLLFQVWAREQQLNEKFIKLNEDNDYFVTWKDNGRIVNRYYHLFTEKELDDLLLQIDDIKIIIKIFEKNNWSFEIEKQ